MSSEEYKNRLKENAIKLVKSHKKQCIDPECDISMMLVSSLLRQADITLTNEEMKDFI